MTAWSWAAASVRGTSHVKNGTRCQDANQCKQVGDTLVAIVADGAGSAEFGGEGASLVARTIMRKAEQSLAASWKLPSEEMVWSWLDEVRDFLALVAERRGSVPRAFASTLIAVLASPTDTLVLHIGDGAGIMKFAAEEEWSVPLWPAHGEYASTTYFVTDDPSPQLRFERVDKAASALVLMTDGLERLALDFSAKTPFAPFVTNMVRPLESNACTGRNGNLSLQLRSYLDSEKVNSRTDDDKTLVIAVRR